MYHEPTRALPALALLGLAVLLAAAPMAAAHSSSPLAGFLPTGDAAMARPIGSSDRSDPAFVSADKPYGVSFKCPLQTGQPDAQVLVDASVCPQYVIDLEDLMGQPVLAIDPNNPDAMAFHSLHGGKGITLPPPLGVPPPTDRSRYNALHQPHTTFQTRDMGASWKDNRYYAPDALMGGNQTVYGEDNAITMDGDGNLYLASLYSHRAPNENTYHYAVGVWKGHHANRLVNYYENFQVLHDDDPVSSLNRIDHVFLSYSPEADRVVLLWLEHGSNQSGSKDARSSWVMAYTSRPGEGARWDPLPVTQQVGPCRALSRPVAYRGQIFFGCRPDTGYSYGGSDVAHWQIHALDARSLTTRYVAPTPIGTTNGVLVDMARTGYMLFVGSGVDASHKPQVQVSRGTLGGNWTDPRDFGNRLARAPAGVAVEEARVTAVAFRKESGYVHLLYMERYSGRPDANRATQQNLHQMFNKTYAVLHWEGNGVGWAGMFDNLNYGHPVSLASVGSAAQYRGVDDSIFDDLHDDIVVWRDPNTGRERIFTVFNDYGATRFAEVLESNPLPLVPLPPIDVLAIPLATTQASASTSGAVAGVITGLMLLRLLMARKKARATAPTT